eukprot:scaffold48222_cov30-Tisochrysis_lutea.AAC.3
MRRCGPKESLLPLGRPKRRLRTAPSREGAPVCSHPSQSRKLGAGYARRCRVRAMIAAHFAWPSSLHECETKASTSLRAALLRAPTSS